MKTRKKYRIIIEDETRLESIAKYSFSPLTAGLWISGIIAAALLIAFFIISLTPIKRVIPGFMPDSRRVASEDALLRVDSLREVYRINEIYLSNLKSVMDSDRKASPPSELNDSDLHIDANSILPRSQEEASFAKIMEEREKFNISVLSKMAAEGMLLLPVSDEGVVTPDSRDSYKVTMMIPAGATIVAVADGVVIAEYFDNTTQSYVVLLQHDNGFVSRIAGLSTPMVGQSDIVSGGEVISLAPQMKNKATSDIYVELWHNGVPVKPYDYIIGRRYDTSTSDSTS